MSIDLSYNIHKRKTLDRIAWKYARQTNAIINKFFEKEADKLIDSLDNGVSYKPNKKKIEELLTKQFEKHFENIIDVGVSDAVVESDPKKLSKVLMIPLDFPVERTLNKKEKEKKDKVTKKIDKKKSKLFGYVLTAIESSSHMYAHAFTEVYKAAADTWFKGDNKPYSTRDNIADVKRNLQRYTGRAKSSVERIFRTETTRHFNQARLEYFKEVDVLNYVQIFAVTDGRISEICNSRHGYVIEGKKAHLKKYMPPFHPNCRTIQRPLNPKIPRHKAMIEKGQKMDERKFADHIHGWGA